MHLTTKYSQGDASVFAFTNLSYSWWASFMRGFANNVVLSWCHVGYVLWRSYLSRVTDHIWNYLSIIWFLIGQYIACHSSNEFHVEAVHLFCMNVCVFHKYTLMMMSCWVHSLNSIICIAILSLVWGLIPSIDYLVEGKTVWLANDKFTSSVWTLNLLSRTHQSHIKLCNYDQKIYHMLWAILW